MVFAGLSAWFRNRDHPIGLSHASVSDEYSLVGLSKEIISGDHILVWSTDRTCTSVLPRPSQWRGWSFISFLQWKATIRVKLGTNQQNTLHKLWNYFNSVTFISCFTPRMGSVALSDMASFFGFMTFLDSLIYCSRRNISSASAKLWNPTKSQGLNRDGRFQQRLT